MKGARVKWKIKFRSNQLLTVLVVFCFVFCLILFATIEEIVKWKRIYDSFTKIFDLKKTNKTNERYKFIYIF